MRVPIVLALALTASLAGGVHNDLPPAAMQEDFDVLRRAVEEAHGGLHRFTPKAELDKRFDAARAGLTRPMSRLAYIGVLSEALAHVRDGHMQLEYDEATTAALGAARMLPLRVASEAGPIVVTSNDSPANDTIRPGMELLSVNGRSIADISRLILPNLSPDGFIETGKAFRMARNFARLYWLFVDQASTFTIVARAADGTAVTAKLDGVTSAARLDSANPVNAVMKANVERLDAPAENVSLRFPRGDAAGVLRVRAFTGGVFQSNVAAAFATLRDKGTKALILDLRANGGGVDMDGSALVSHFVARPFRYFDHIKVTTVKPSFATWRPDTFDNLKAGTSPAPDGGFRVLPQLHPGVAEQKPAAAPFVGRVFVLIDGGTFSTAADVCAQIRSLTKATFIGEETGGGFEGNTSGLNADIVLPRSGLRLRIQMYGYWNAVRGGQPGRGTLPDITIVRRTADTLAGRDAALERALTLATS
jgi:hypothetical protein